MMRITTRSARCHAAAVVALVAVVAGATACSLPVDERVRPIDRDQFGEQLTQDTTTTTSTVPETAPGTTEDVPVTGPTTTTTTTMAPIPTEVIKVFYPRGATDVMQEVSFDVAVDPPIEEVITLLESQSGLAGAGLRTAVRAGLIDGTPVVDRVVATVTLDADVIDRMPNAELERAIAQIVLTLTSFRTPDAGNIGAVRFEVDGNGFSVFVPAFGGASEPGEALAFTDFASLIATTPTPDPTTTAAPDESGSSDPTDTSTATTTTTADG